MSTCSVFITVNLTGFKFIIVSVFISLCHTMLGAVQICAVVDRYNRNSNSNLTYIRFILPVVAFVD